MEIFSVQCGSVSKQLDGIHISLHRRGYFLFVVEFIMERWFFVSFWSGCSAEKLSLPHQEEARQNLRKVWVYARSRKSSGITTFPLSTFFKKNKSFISCSAGYAENLLSTAQTRPRAAKLHQSSSSHQFPLREILPTQGSSSQRSLALGFTSEGMNPGLVWQKAAFVSCQNSWEMSPGQPELQIQLRAG